MAVPVDPGFSEVPLIPVFPDDGVEYTVVYQAVIDYSEYLKCTQVGTELIWVKEKCPDGKKCYKNECLTDKEISSKKGN